MIPQTRCTMGLDRLPRGNFRARLMAGGRTYTATFPTRKEACEWLVVTRGRVVGARAARTLTVEEYAGRWLGEFIDTAADVDRYRRDVTGHIVPALGSRPLVEIAPGRNHVTDRADQRRGVTGARGAGPDDPPRTFGDAVVDGIIASSPVPDLVSPDACADHPEAAHGRMR
jgi:hypothetical protein